MSIAIFACGKSIASIKSVWTWNTPNWYKVPQSVVELCDYIMSDSSIESKVVAFPFPLNLWVRQYQPGIIMPFAWDVTECQDLHDAMEEDPINLDHVSSLAADFGCTYVVLQADANYIGCMEDYIEIWRIDRVHDFLYRADNVTTTLFPNIFGSHVKNAGPSAWMCTTSYFPNAL